MTKEHQTSELFASDEDYAGLVLKFLSGLPPQIEALETALGAGKLEAAARHAHKLAGGAGVYGYPDLAGAARSLEGAAKEKLRSEAESHLKTVQRFAAEALRGRHDERLLKSAEKIGRSELDLDLLMSLVEVFIEEHKERLREIETAVESRDAAALKEAARSFERMIERFCSEQALTALKNLRAAAEKSDFAAARDALSVLNREIENAT